MRSVNSTPLMAKDATFQGQAMKLASSAHHLEASGELA